MRKTRLYAILLPVLLVCLSILVSVSSVAAEEKTIDDAEAEMQAALTYQGMSMRLSGDISGIRSIFEIDNTVVDELEYAGFTVTYGAIMGVAEKGNKTYRSNAEDLTVVADPNLGYRTEAAKASSVVVYATGSPKYASNIFAATGAQKSSFAFTTLFGNEYETAEYYDLKMLYRAFFVVQKGTDVRIGYIDMQSGSFDGSVSLADLADHFCNAYNGASAATYRQNRLVLRAYAVTGGAAVTPDAAQGSGVSVLSDGTHLLTNAAALTLSASVPATGFYRLTAKTNREGGYIESIDCTRAARTVGETTYPAYTSAYAVGTSGQTASPDGNGDYMTSVGGSTETLGYQYLIAGENTLTLRSSLAVGLSDFTLTLMELPIHEKESLLLHAVSDKAEETGSVSVSNDATVGFAAGSTVTYAVTPKTSAVYSASLLASVQNATVTLTVTDENGEVQTLATGVGVSGSYPTANAASKAYIPLSGELHLAAGTTYRVTLSLDAGSARLDYILLQSRDTYNPGENTVRVDLWSPDAETTTTGTKLADGKTYYLASGKTITFRVNALREGFYAMRLLESHAEKTKRVQFIATSDKEIYGKNKIEYVSRFFPEGGTEAGSNFLGTDPNELIVEQAKLNAKLAGDAYGFMYLHKGENTVTFTVEGFVFAVAAVEFTLDAAYRPNSNDIRIQANDSNTVSGTVNKNTKAKGSYTLGTDGSVTYSFTVKKSGTYDIYSYIGAKGESTSAQVALTVKGVTDPAYSQTVSYTHSAQYLSAANDSRGAYSVHFPKPLYLEAGDYTVTWTAVAGNSQNNLYDIRLIERDAPVLVPATEASCKDGNIAYYYQASTGKCYEDAEGKTEISYEDTVIPGTAEHDFGEWTASVLATCDARGVKSRTCRICNSIDASFIAPEGHHYTNWTVTKEPTLTEEGEIAHTCESEHHTGGTVCTEALPPLSPLNGYRLTYENGVDSEGKAVTGTKPTPTTAGEGFYIYKKGAQTFTFRSEVPCLNDYYNSLDGAILIPSETVAAGATLADSENSYYDADSHTVLLGDLVADSVTLTVNAKQEGFYALYMKLNNHGKKVKLTVKNNTMASWNANMPVLLPLSAKNTDVNYLMLSYEYKEDFSETPILYVYLQKGENELLIDPTAVDSGAELGISDILLVAERTFSTTETKTVVPYTASTTSTNGWVVEEGKSLSIPFAVDKDGTYTVYALLSTSGADILLDSASNSFPSATVTLPKKICSGNNIADEKKTLAFCEVATLQLTEGAHTARFSLKSVDNQLSEYLHIGLLVLVRTGEKEPNQSMHFDLDKKLNAETNQLTLTMQVSGLVPETGSQNMTVVVSGYYTYTDGTEKPFSKIFKKTAYNETLSFMTDALVGALDGVSYKITVYDDGMSTLLHEEKLRHYSLRDTLTLFMISDTHYTGSNLAQDLRNYKYEIGHDNGWDWSEEIVLKSLDSYRTSYEAWGWSSDEKMTRLIDDILQRYEAGEFDIVFFLGDQSMGDGNYPNFASDHIVYKAQSHFGQNLLDYWDHPLNTNFIYEKQFMDRLAAAGVPYFCSFGNHETLMEYNENKTDVSYQSWENEYHYQELFGHKNASGEIYDATPNDYFIRVIRRNGEMKILSALSSSELEAFKARQAGDGNCYDYFVSEDSLTADDIELGSILATHTYQIGSYDKYMKKYTYGTDPETGELVTTLRDYNGQTIRTEYVSRNILEGMEPMFAEAKNIYMVSHNSSDANHLFSDLFHKYPQFKAMFIGDVHDETYAVNLGLVPRWVVGCFSQAYDVDFYYTYDENGNQLGGDKQYYKDGKVDNSIEGDYRYHAFSYMMLHIKGSEAYAERERIGFFYKNTEPEYQLLVDRVTGWDPDYTRAVDYTREPGESFTFGNRTLFVGGDCFVTGKTHFNIAKSYTRGAYNPAEYVLYPTETSSVYTVCDLAGRPLTGGDTTVTLTATKEGTALTLNGETYYIVSKSGGVVGHYLYDENGDFVYVDKNGDYVFYDFYTDENGEYVKEYFYEKEDGSFVALGEWNADHTKYTLKDGIYTDMWLAGDPMTVSRLDGCTDDAELLHKVTVQYSAGKYRVESGTIEIKNGIVMRGLGFMNYGYAYRFVDANGNEVNKADVQQNLTHTYTYSLKNPAGYTLGKSLTASDFNIEDNDMTTTFGFYQPRMKYNKSWIDK